MNNINQYNIAIDDESGTADRTALDEPKAQVVAENKDYLVIKIPGHKAWSRVGEQAYHSPEFVVFEIIEHRKRYDDGRRRILGEKLIEWENKRKKPRAAGTGGGVLKLPGHKQ